MRWSPWLALVFIATVARPGSSSFPVYLRDGRTLQSSRKPLSLQGKVGVYDEQRRLTWIPAAEVDLARSRDAWEVAAGRAAQDADRLMGKKLFPIEFIDESGAKRSVTPSAARFTFVEIFSPY